MKLHLHTSSGPMDNSGKAREWGGWNKGRNKRDVSNAEKIYLHSEDKLIIYILNDTQSKKINIIRENTNNRNKTNQRCTSGNII